MIRRVVYLPLTFLAFVLLAVSAPTAATAASNGTVFTVPANATLTLSTGETLTVSGSLDVAITQFKVQGDKIVAKATVNGTLTGTTSAGDTVTATFTNAKVVLVVSNVQADCSTGTLSFDLRAVIPPAGIDVTVNGEPASLKKSTVLTTTVTVSTASISDRSLAGRVSALICQIDSQLRSGASLDTLTNSLNRLLRLLA